MTWHYHGTPITPKDQMLRLAGRNFCVSFARPDDVVAVHEIASSVMLDNGAFSFWRSGKPMRKGYYEWCERWLEFRTDWAVIPDVIDGSEEENDRLIADWPFGHRGAPVWHLHESVERLQRLAAEWPLVCLGSSGAYAEVGTPAWHRRMTAVMNALCGNGPPPCALHMLRGMRLAGSHYPFASVDSTMIGRNHGGDNFTRRKRLDIVELANRYDAQQCPARWHYLGDEMTLEEQCSESDPSSPASAALTLVSNAPEASRPSGSPRSTPSVAKSSPSTGPTPLTAPTSATSPSTTTPSAPSTSSSADSPARTSLSLVTAADSMAPALVFGRRCSESFASLDRATSSWRTSQLSLLEGSGEFSQSWPRAGMTRNGTAYRLQPLAPLTAETGSGSLPTPSASSYGTNQGGGAGRTGPVRPSLETMARQALWPTPTARDWKSGAASEATHDRNSRPLNEVVRRAETWPTPTASDSSGNGGWEGREGGPGLRTAVAMWPTPNSRDEKGRPGAGTLEAGGRHSSLPAAMEHPGPLNPEWVGWLMGFPPRWTDIGTPSPKASPARATASQTAKPDCAPSATPSSPKSPNGSESESSPPSLNVETQLELLPAAAPKSALLLS